MLFVSWLNDFLQSDLEKYLAYHEISTVNYMLISQLALKTKQKKRIPSGN